MEPAEQDLLHILAIDDDPDMRKLITDILLPGGHQVFAVGSAEEGLELLPYNTMQIAFLDQNLPGMDGSVLAEYLRRNNPHMKIALVTGEEESSLDHFGEVHEITVIRKPFDVRQILDVVSAYREDAKARLEARLAKEAPDYDPPIGRYQANLVECFGMPNVSARIEERLIQVIKSSLSELRTVSRYNERARVVALCGLLTMQVLGIRPKGTARSLYEQYDEVMRAHGRRTEFDS